MELISGFLIQLWKRKVVQFGVLYLGAAWLLLQVAVMLEQTLKLPDWVDQTVLVLLMIGFPLLLILAWAQETRVERFVAPEQASKDVNVKPSADAPSVVVLPFRARLDDEVEELTAEGLSDDITTLLTSVKGIKVIPRQAVGRRLAPEDDALQIATELSSRYVLTGSVRRNGEELRVSCELTDLDDKEQKWSQRFDRSAEDIFAIQDEIARGVVSTVGGIISRVESARALRQPPENLEAWELTRRALSIVWDWRPDTLRQAILDTRKAIELDANYALAHSVLGMVLSWRAVSGWTENVDDERDEALREAEIALRLGFDNAEALWPVINVYWAIDPTRSIQIYERSIARQPDVFLGAPFGLAHAGVAYARAGRVDEGIALIQQYQDTFPSDEYGAIWTRVFFAYSEMCRRNYALASDLLVDTASEHDGMCRVVSLMMSGDGDEALAEFDRWKSANPAIKLDHYVEYFKGYHATDKTIGAELSGSLIRLKEKLSFG